MTKLIWAECSDIDSSDLYMPLLRTPTRYQYRGAEIQNIVYVFDGRVNIGGVIIFENRLSSFKGLRELIVFK